MFDYDVTLKLLISEATESTLRMLGFPAPVSRWLNVELPQIRNPRVDMLAELVNGELLQIELQSSNYPDMELRMLEWAVGIWRKEGRFPRQVVIYTGNEPVRMVARVQGPGIDYRYQIVDIRELDGEALLSSNGTSDNILALLTGVPDKVDAIRRILARIARLEPGRREDALRKVLILCGLRGLVGPLRQEEDKMPIDLDIRDHEVLGPVLRAGEAKGLRKALGRLLEKRFGPLPLWAKKRFDEASDSEVDDLLMKILDAQSLNEIFG